METLKRIILDIYVSSDPFSRWLGDNFASLSEVYWSPKLAFCFEIATWDCAGPIRSSSQLCPYPRKRSYEHPGKGETRHGPQLQELAIEDMRERFHDVRGCLMM